MYVDVGVVRFFRGGCTVLAGNIESLSLEWTWHTRYLQNTAKMATQAIILAAKVWPCSVDPSQNKLLLSIVTKTGRGCLDIEAPTRLDRDKFASAFSVFLGVPMEEESVVELRSVGESFGEIKWLCLQAAC